MPTLTANGETLSYRMEGSGPTLLMIHSLGTNACLWDRQIAHWRDRYTCIAFDARGHGASSNIDNPDGVHAAVDSFLDASR